MNQATPHSQTGKPQPGTSTKLSGSIVMLEDVTELKQTLMIRPPVFVHGAIAIFTALVVAGIMWASFFKIDRLVRGRGQIRASGAPSVALAIESGSNVVAEVAGKIQEVAAAEGQEVKAGDLLVRIDTRTLENQIEGEKQLLEIRLAELSRLQAMRTTLVRKHSAELNRVRSEIRLAEIDYQMAKIVLEKKTKEEERVRALAGQGHVSRVELEQAEASRKQAELEARRQGTRVDTAQIGLLQQEMSLIRARQAAAMEELEIRIQAKRGEIEARTRTLENQTIQGQNALVRAHVNGLLTDFRVRVGDYVRVGDRIAAITEPGPYQLDALISSKDIGKIKDGLPVKVKIDAFDYQRYGHIVGRIAYVSPESRAFPNGMVAYEVRVALESNEIGKGNDKGQIRLGMTGQAEIITGYERIIQSILYWLKDRTRIR